MKCQILFSGKNKKNISKCRLLKILPRVLSVNTSGGGLATGHSITYIITCAPCEDSDQPAPPYGMISIRRAYCW